MKNKIKIVSDCCKVNLERIHGGITGFECTKCQKPCNQEFVD